MGIYHTLFLSFLQGQPPARRPVSAHDLQEKPCFPRCPSRVVSSCPSPIHSWLSRLVTFCISETHDLTYGHFPLTFWHHNLKVGVIVAGSLKLEQKTSTVLLLRKNTYWTSGNQSTPNLWKPMAYVLGMAKDLWPVTIQIEEKERAYIACRWNWQQLQLEMNESSDTN